MWCDFKGLKNSDRVGESASASGSIVLTTIATMYEWNGIVWDGMR